MPRCTPLFALLFAALTSTTASANVPRTPTSPSQPPSDAALDASHAAYAQQWDTAIEQSRSGNTLAALIAMERLMDSPLLADFDAERRGRAAQIAGWTAAMQKQPALARRYLQQALLALPGDASILTTLVSLDLNDDQPAAAVEHLTQALAHADSPLAIDHHTVSYLQYHLREQPAQRMALLQALFDNGWKSAGTEPTGLWLELATLQADNGRGDAIPTTLARIDTPAELIRLRSDKRFDRYVDRHDARFDPVKAAQAHLDTLRVSGLLDGDLDARLVDFSSTLLMLDRNEEVLALTDDLAEAVAQGQALSAVKAEWLAWLLNSRVAALRRLGRTDEVLETAKLAARIGALGPDGLEHQMNVAFVLSSLGQAQEADAAIATLTDLSGYGQAAQAVIQFAAARQRGDAAAAAAARAVIVAQRKDARLFHREMLLEEGDLDGAAAVLIEQLRSPLERSDALASLQDMRVYPSLPGDVRIDAAWRELKQRADVQAEVSRVGRIERYELVGSATSR
ncbi:hypothetical protein TEP_17230 [Stenotrophomonas sp. TEPEL]|uniref:hypothetical protein n=1 Tax=Stenotrophomonas sp. TEPEL TaxID=2283801 RepID=UPI001043BDCD|nr:hypothetical protein [Stenotrophomonas sp. TEPEL]TDB35239.1 hypothetical protein TEP_17230 [Stenotrophomonas sp. TEPEL]